MADSSPATSIGEAKSNADKEVIIAWPPPRRKLEARRKENREYIAAKIIATIFPVQSGNPGGEWTQKRLLHRKVERGLLCLTSTCHKPCFSIHWPNHVRYDHSRIDHRHR